MDSQASLARSPPQFSKDLITTAIGQYKILLKSIAAKRSAIDKLQHSMPKSIQHRIDLKVSTMLQDAKPTEAAELQRRFKTVIEEAQTSMKEVILETAKTELELMLETRSRFRLTYGSKIHDYFNKVFVEARQLVGADANLDFAPVIPDKAPAILHAAVSDFNRSVEFLDSSLDRVDYEDLLATTLRQQRQAERQAQQASAETMELETSNEVLVAALVKQEVAKKTSALNKEINQLRAALNASANRSGARDGANLKPKKTLQATKQPSQPSRRRRGGERVRGQALGRSNSNSTSKSKGRQQGRPNAKPRYQQKSGN